MKKIFCLLLLCILIGSITIDSTSALILGWETETFGTKIIVEEGEEPPEPGSINWASTTFGTKIIVEDEGTPEEVNTSWVSTTFGTSITVTGYEDGEWYDWWKLTKAGGPTITDESPANESDDQSLSLTWSATIESPQGNSFNWWINCSNGQSNSASSDTNGSKSLSISGLVNNTEYTVDVDAVDTVLGYKTSNWFTFRTQTGNIPPTVQTRPATSVTDDTMVLNGLLAEDGTETCEVRFEYGTSELFGNTTTIQYQTEGLFSQEITGLTPGSLLFYRAKASNSKGSDSGTTNNSLVKPNQPGSVTAESYGLVQINLSWSKGTGSNRTVVERNTESTWSRGDGTQIYNNTGTSYDDTGLNQNTLYYYRMWGYSTWNNGSYVFHEYSYNVSAISNTTNAVDPPYNGNSSVHAGTVTCNLTWERGNYSNQEVVVGKTTGYPSSVTDGTVYQNSTALYYNFSISQTIYFTVFSYNSTHKFYSLTSLDIPWGALRLNVFNASKTWQKVDPFGLFIQNQAGTETYTNQICSPPFYLDIKDIPIGEDTIFRINASGYKTQQYIKDTFENNFYNYTFLLPPLDTSTPGGGDIDPETGEPTNETSTLLYLISVIGEFNNPLPEALVTFKLYVNASDTYEDAGGFLTDGNGQGTLYLTPGNFYQVVISKDRYHTAINYWTPSDELLTKTFMLYLDPSYLNETYLPNDVISVNSDISGTTLFVNITNTWNNLTDVRICVNVINHSTGLESELINQTYSYDNTITFNVAGLNISNDHRVIVHLNHSNFGYLPYEFYFAGEFTPLTSAEEFDDVFTSILKWNPFGWSNFILLLFVVVGFYSSERSNLGSRLMLMGAAFLVFNFFIGFNSHFVTWAGGIIPPLVIFAGFLIMWDDYSKNKRGS